MARGWYYPRGFGADAEIAVPISSPLHPRHHEYLERAGLGWGTPDPNAPPAGDTSDPTGIKSAGWTTAIAVLGAIGLVLWYMNKD